MPPILVDFGKFFVWSNRAAILPVALALPCAIEAIKFGYKAYHNPHLLQEKAIAAKEFVVSSFTQHEGESDWDFKKRVMKNVAIGACFLCAAAGGIAGAVLLPYYLGIPIAFTVIALLADLAVNGKSYCLKFTQKVTQIKAAIIDNFTPRPGESHRDFAMRRLKGIAIASACTILALGTIAAAVYLVQYALAALAAGRGGLWDPYNLLPGQKYPVVVFLEYAVLGVLHGALAVKNLLHGDKAAAAYYAVNMLLSFAFPIYYLLTATPKNPMRLHHSFLGLALQLMPFRAVKVLGAFTTIDSAMYMLSPVRSYDFQNLLVDNLKAFLAVISSMSAWQFITDRVLWKKDATSCAEQHIATSS